MRQTLIDEAPKYFDELSIELTHRCNLNCIYCSSDASNANKEFIEIKRLLQIITEVKNKYKAHTISLSGGETFLYPNFQELYDFLTDNDFQIIIYTSGIVSDQEGLITSLSQGTLSRLRLGENNPKIILNIQGHSKSLTEKINGLPGSYELIGKTIENTLSSSLFLGANIVPFSANYENLEDIYDYCYHKHFDEINFLRFVPQGRGTERGLYNTKKEFAKISESIKSLLVNKKESRMDIRIGHPINFLFLVNGKYLYTKEKTHYCRGGLDAPLILPNGDVSMCPAWKNLSEFSAGNIYKQDFQEIWESHYFSIFRCGFR